MVHCAWSPFSTLSSMFKLGFQSNSIYSTQTQETGTIGIQSTRNQNYLGVGSDFPFNKLYAEASSPGTIQEKFKIVENEDGTISIFLFYTNKYVGIGGDDRAYVIAGQTGGQQNFVLFPNEIQVLA